jgi:hypothetical protein
VRAGQVLVKFTDGVTKYVSPAGAKAAIDAGDGVEIKTPKFGFQEAVQAARPFAAMGLPSSPYNPMLGKMATDPQTIAMAATAPFGGEGALLARGLTGMAAAGGAAAAQGSPVVPNMLLAGAPEPLGDAAAAGVRGGARMAMKTSLGRAAVGSVEKALKYGLAPTQKFMDFIAGRIGELKTQAVAAANDLEAAGHATTLDALAKPIRASQARYAANDVTGTETQNALQSVLDEMTNKLGPKTTKTPASKVLGPNGQPAVAAKVTVTPAQPITPTQLQEINQIAGQKLKDLFAAKQGKLGVPPDPRELGYMKVWSRSKQLLEGMGGDTGKSIGRANKEMQDLYKMDTLARNAGMRPHGFTGLERAGAAAGLTGGLLAHNPLAAAASIPAAAALHAATSPEGMAAIGRGLNTPMAQALARFSPRLGAVGVGQFMNQ